MRADDDFDLELRERCACGAEHGQALVGPHDALEIVRVGGRDLVRRHEILPCPAHVEAILRAREFGLPMRSIILRGLEPEEG